MPTANEKTFLLSTSKEANVIRYLRQTVSTVITAHLVFLAGCATTPLQQVGSAENLVPLTSEGSDGVGSEESNSQEMNEPIVELPSERQQPIIFRGQTPDSTFEEDSYESERPRQPMPISGVEDFDPNSSDGYFNSDVEQSQYGEPYGNAYGNPYSNAPVDQQFNPYAGADGYQQQPRRTGPPTIRPGDIGFGDGPTHADITQPFSGRYADLEVNVQEQQTGRFMFGVGVNSDAGLTAQVVVDEYNFDWRRFPRQPGDILNGTAFRGGGQRLRIEAVPGSELQRYMVNFTEPYLILGGHQFTLNLSGYLYDRRYFDWDEQRLGGRVGLGYRVTPDLSLNTSLRMENVNINDPRIRGITELEEVLGDSGLYSGTVSLRHDTRDSPFAPTEGHLFDISFEQAFGTFSYPRGVAEYRRFFLLNERVDGSGRHVLGTSIRAGFSGSDTPLFEHFYAGGYSTIRGFRFRGASPKNGDVTVGGEFSLLGSVEYLFPVTADDMLKGVVFCDYGTIEEEIEINKDDFRVSVGAGLRVTVPAMGPAPIALDFAVPISREDTDRIQNFSFFVGFGR